MGLNQRIAAPVTFERRAPASWRELGSCRDSDPNLFFPVGRGRAALEQAEVAKSICRGCPSLAPCLAFALDTKQELGVWGSTSSEDRRELRRAQRRLKAV
jgi:WhiB family transcriptional regulator, redox-sensing transcriptional regulator